MDEITRSYDMENHLRSLRQSCDAMAGPMFFDDRVAVLGDFLRTCDSMMSGFESLCDGMVAGSVDNELSASDPVGHVPTFELWMDGDRSVGQ